MKKKILFFCNLFLFIGSNNSQIDLNFPKSTPPDSSILSQKKIVYKFSVNGVVTASAFCQDGVFGMGDGAVTMWANAVQPDKQKLQTGFDIRKTWLILKSTAYNLPNKWEASGRVELDLLGGFSGVGGMSDENILPRIRLAYLELYKNRTRIRFGQNWTPLVAFFPTSITHFAMGYGSAGGIGFRNPGIFLYQHLNKTNAKVKVRLDAAVFRGSWSGSNSSDPFKRDEGEIGIPQMELGLNVSRMDKPFKWEMALVGHYDRKNLYNATTTEYKKLDGYALQFGGRLMYKNFSFQANAYTGRAIGQLWGNLLQFGDIEGSGAWAQLSYKFLKNWTLSVMSGLDDPKDSHVLNSIMGNSRLANYVIVPMLKYDFGPVQIGFEWFYAQTKWNIQNGSFNSIKSTYANQYALGVSYTF